MPRFVTGQLPEHHDVRTRRVASGEISQTTRGFFAVDMQEAIHAAIRWRLGVDDEDGYVARVVNDSAATAGTCDLSSVPASKHDAVLAAINASSSDRYHLFLHNCQHWATKMLKK